MLENCLKYLENGQLAKAVSTLFKKPENSLDALPAKQKDLANYLDALAFGYFNDALIANQVLQQQNWLSPKLRARLHADECLLQVLRRFEDQLPEFLASAKGRSLPQASLHCLLAEKKGDLIDEKTLNSLPEQLKALLHFGQANLKLERAHPSLFQRLKEGDLFFSRPFLPLSFQAPEGLLSASCEAIRESKNLPVILMEQWDWDWSKILEALKGRAAVFAFPSLNTLFQCTQFPELLKALTEPKQQILVLSHYPQISKLEPFNFISLSTRQAWVDCQKELVDALGRLNEPDYLYRLGRNLHDSWQAKRLGESRLLSFHSLRKNRDWNDPHKGRLGDETGQSQVLKNELAPILNSALPLFPRRQVHPGSKIRIAHIMPQLVREGHAPTKLIRTLCRYHDRNQFDLCLFSTERLVFRAQEYPYDPYGSAPSVLRAGEILKEIQDSGVQVFVDDAKLSYKDTAKRLAQSLAKLGIDIAVFHGPDVINSLASRYCDAPLRVLFEHGSLPKFPGFDLAIASSKESEERLSAQLAEIGTSIKALPFCYDPRSQWQETKTPLKKFGIPEGAQVLTTISNNLESRVTGEMCWAISEILKACPNAYYAPIGYISNADEFRQRFEGEDVQKRIVVLGEQPDPSQVSRSMHIYLNEFPFGSGLAILDAMAAGCPMLSMHYPDGPPQGRYGAVFMGMDRVVTSCKAKDYVELCSNLLQDSELYSEWSAHALKRFESQADPLSYVAELEATLLKYLSKDKQVTHVSP